MTAVVLMHRYFGRAGLYGLAVLSLVLCNIQVLKTVTLFGMTTTLGNILYASVFLTTDILGELYGRESARKAVYLGFAALILATIYMQLALAFQAGPEDFAQEHLAVIFGFLPRITLASLAAYLLSQLHDVWAFQFWRGVTQGRHLWLRNMASTLVSQLLDSAIFVLIAFTGVFPWPVVQEIFITTYLMKLIVAALDTPFIYLARQYRPQAESHGLAA
jgi:hypothetical protein